MGAASSKRVVITLYRLLLYGLVHPTQDGCLATSDLACQVFSRGQHDSFCPAIYRNASSSVRIQLPVCAGCEPIFLKLKMRHQLVLTNSGYLARHRKAASDRHNPRPNSAADRRVRERKGAFAGCLAELWRQMRRPNTQLRMETRHLRDLLVLPRSIYSLYFRLLFA